MTPFAVFACGGTGGSIVAGTRSSADVRAPGSIPAPNRDGWLVYIAGVSWDDVQGTDRHLATVLARRLPVLWVDPPQPVLGLRRTGERMRPWRLDRLTPDLVRLTPFAPPGPTRPVIRSVVAPYVDALVAATVRRLGARVLATVVSAPEMRRGYGRRIYLATDDFVAGAGLMGLSADRLRRMEARQLAAADVVAGVSTTLVDRWSAQGHRVVHLPNGADVDHFRAVDQAPLPAGVVLPGPVAGVVGNLSSRIDVDLLTAVADRDCSLLLVGPRRRDDSDAAFAALLERPNVAWVDRRPFAELPSYLRMIDVGLTPYVDTAFNRASFPLKTLEYLSAGRGVVATDLPATRWLGTDLVRVATGRDAFADAVVTELHRPRTAAVVDARRRFAATHSWERRADQLMEIAGLAPAAEPARPVAAVGRA